MQGFLHKLTSLDDAVKMALRELSLNPRVEEKPLTQALGKIAAEDVYAPYSLPLNNRSAVDGYAVRAEDTYGATPSSPAELQVVTRVSVDSDPSSIPSIGRGEAAEIATGAPLPPGANAVVMYEDTERRGNRILVYRGVPVWGNVSRRGEDFEEGEPVVRRGTVIRPWHIGALASLGISRVKTLRVRAAIISTGDEVVELGDGGPPPPGRVYNSTALLVSSYLREKGLGEPSYLGVVGDREEDLYLKLRDTASRYDYIVTTGGTGVSSGDIVPRVVERLGRIIIRGIAMRPGRPTSIGVVHGKPVFMVSGFPVAALAALEAVVTPVVTGLLEARLPESPVVEARLTRRLANAVGYTSFFRVRVYECGGELCVEPLRITGSGILSTLVRGNGILVVPEHVEGYEAGEKVRVILINPLEREKG